MAYKVVVDAGHGGADPGAVFQGRQEKDDVLRLAMEVGRLLQEQGIDVEYTRTEDVYETPFQKATKANQSGADFFVSLHRNSSPMQNQYSGVETLVYDDYGEKVEVAEKINANLEDLGFRNIGVKERPGLVVLRRTQMPAVLVETGFINNTADNQLFDDQFQNIAAGIADGIIQGLGIGNGDNQETPDEEQEDPNQVLYRVQVGSYRNRQNAENMLHRVLMDGYPGFILPADGLYKVQVGAFANLENAVRMEQRLRRSGYNTFIAQQ